MESKVCCTCKVDKPHSEFYHRKKNGYISSNCCVCILKQRKIYNQTESGKQTKFVAGLRRRYGITFEEFTRVWSEQQGKCFVCRQDLVLGVKNGYAIDHDHQTGQVRGILCTGCNLSIGHAGDNSNRLRALAAYLDYHETSNKTGMTKTL